MRATPYLHPPNQQRHYHGAAQNNNPRHNGNVKPSLLPTVFLLTPISILFLSVINGHRAARVREILRGTKNAMTLHSNVLCARLRAWSKHQTRMAVSGRRRRHKIARRTKAVASYLLCEHLLGNHAVLKGPLL